MQWPTSAFAWPRQCLISEAIAHILDPLRLAPLAVSVSAVSGPTPHVCCKYELLPTGSVTVKMKGAADSPPMALAEPGAFQADHDT